MSGHADTIRRVLNWPMAYYNETESAAAWDALDVLVAENQQLRGALEAVASAFTAWSEDWNDGTYAYYKSDDLMVACVAARAALERWRPWLDAAAKWQKILDSSIPGSAPALIARERLDYIDTQLARLAGTPSEDT
jgi:hypothetical protein